MSAANILEVTDASFEAEVMKSDKPVLVDFWAPWCGPCKLLAPTLDEIAKEYDGRVKVVKFDVAANDEVTSKLGLRGVPTLMVFKGGEIMATKVGLMSKEAMNNFLDRWL